MPRFASRGLWRNGKRFLRTRKASQSELWDEVYSYIEAHYDLGKVKQIYLNSDGGTWIKSGYKRIHGIEYVLDEFHLSKYLLKMTGHMLDSQQDAGHGLCKIIRSGSKEEFQAEAENLKGYTESEKKKGISRYKSAAVFFRTAALLRSTNFFFSPPYRTRYSRNLCISSRKNTDGLIRLYFFASFLRKYVNTRQYLSINDAVRRLSKFWNC